MPNIRQKSTQKCVYYTVCPIEYTHSFVVLCFVVVVLSIWYICPYLSWLLHWKFASNIILKDMGKTYLYQTTTKHNSVNHVCISGNVHAVVWYHGSLLNKPSILLPVWACNWVRILGIHVIGQIRYIDVDGIDCVAVREGIDLKCCKISSNIFNKWHLI